MSARKRKQFIDAKQCARARWWLGYEFGEEEDLESWLQGQDDEDCPHCRGDGRDPWNDYLLPCPLCQGEQCP